MTPKEKASQFLIHNQFDIKRLFKMGYLHPLILKSIDIALHEQAKEIFKRIEALDVYCYDEDCKFKHYKDYKEIKDKFINKT